MRAYDGPLRAEPPAVELSNTIYATAAGPADGLGSAAAARAWLAALGDRLPSAGHGTVRLAPLLELRDAVRAVLLAASAGDALPRGAVDHLNDVSAAAPVFVAGRLDRRGSALLAALDWGDARREQVVLAALARSAIELVGGPRRADLQACGAPGCVLLYVRSHHRQGWCSPACGNRARQARHYRRAHPHPGD